MRLLLIALLLSGCAHNPTFTDRTVEVRITIADDLYVRGAKVAGYSAPLETPCRIVIDREHYTNEIVGHEVIHCFDGFWHELINSDMSRDELNRLHRSKFE